MTPEERAERLVSVDYFDDDEQNNGHCPAVVKFRHGDGVVVFNQRGHWTSDLVDGMRARLRKLLADEIREAIEEDRKTRVAKLLEIIPSKRPKLTLAELHVEFVAEPADEPDQPLVVENKA